jgi:RNA polymerase sigma-70 factor (ECF subfamily)
VLLTRHARASLAVAHAVVGDLDQAEDVCQDAMFRVWQRLGECRDPTRFGAWLARAVHRHALNSLRRRRGESLEDQQLVADSPGPDTNAERLELRERLERGLMRLSTEQREAVVLFDMEGWSHGAIATFLETTEAMSRQHLMLGRRRLRQLLEGKEEHHDR